MTTKRDLDTFTDEALEAELSRRRGRRAAALDGYDAELSLEVLSQRDADAAFATYLQGRADAQTLERKPCPRCGALVRVRRKHVVRTVRSMGAVHHLARHYHYCDFCRRGFYPLDIDLRLPEEGDVTALMEQRVLDMGLHATFEDGAERFALHHGTTISENLIRRVVDRVGRRAEQDDAVAERLRPRCCTPADTVTLQFDGSMVSTRGQDAWREAKVGMIYRDAHHVGRAPGRRGMVTEARFVARLGDYPGFKKALVQAADLEGADQARRVVVVGDGAPWVWNLADEIHPDVIKILDYPHAVEHAVDAAKVLFPHTPDLVALWHKTVEKQLNDGRVDRLLHDLRACARACRGKARAALLDLIRYYDTNAPRMHYDRYRRDGLPCGSGAVESAHRHVLQKRMKLAGQHWDPTRADRMARLRAALATCGPRHIYPRICAQPQAA